jgi:hypothetical protein
VGIELSPVELAALEALDPRAIQRFAQAVDTRLQKAELVSEAGMRSPRANGEEA